jgi:hypothetical protein
MPPVLLGALAIASAPLAGVPPDINFGR